jgi:hypothetical protein
MTAISPNAVAALRPLKLGTQPVRRAGGRFTMHDTYDIRIRFGGHSAQGRWFNLEAVEIQPATAGVGVLIGLELLLKIDMVWLGPRKRLFLSF